MPISSLVSTEFNKQPTTFLDVCLAVFSQLWLKPCHVLTTIAPAQASISTNFKGPTNGDYAISDQIPFTSTIWSPCGAALPLNINSQVRLTSTKSGASGLLTQDSIDGKVTYVVGVQWQKCTLRINPNLKKINC